MDTDPDDLIYGFIEPSFSNTGENAEEHGKSSNGATPYYSLGDATYADNVAGESVTNGNAGVQYSLGTANEGLYGESVTNGDGGVHYSLGAAHESLYGESGDGTRYSLGTANEATYKETSFTDSEYVLFPSTPYYSLGAAKENKYTPLPAIVNDPTYDSPHGKTEPDKGNGKTNPYYTLATATDASGLGTAQYTLGTAHSKGHDALYEDGVLQGKLEGKKAPEPGLKDNGVGHAKQYLPQTVKKFNEDPLDHSMRVKLADSEYTDSHCEEQSRRMGPFRWRSNRCILASIALLVCLIAAIVCGVVLGMGGSSSHTGTEFSKDAGSSSTTTTVPSSSCIRTLQ